MRIARTNEIRARVLTGRMVKYINTDVDDVAVDTLLLVDGLLQSMCCIVCATCFHSKQQFVTVCAPRLYAQRTALTKFIL